jgi:serine/threonine-protein kinase
MDAPTKMTPVVLGMVKLKRSRMIATFCELRCGSGYSRASMANREPSSPGSDALGPRVDAILLTFEMHEGETLLRAPLSTIEPPRSDAEAARLHGSLLDAAPRSSHVRLESVLGEGGMGVVYLAEQESLRRKVAVKTVRADARSPASVARLLQEAWVIGQLEHPNILPVYDISESDSGEPLIVLKRIDGVEWGQLMNDAAAVATRFRALDLLEWNLDVMARVCDAVHFAHARGFIHRDLKPENVLIGELGEVYVADWGIAVSTRDDHGMVPHARHAKEIAGTPAYMAPEMLGGEVSRISEKTDVYLLGGILHEILIGHPPHRGTDLREMITSILTDARPLPESVPPALRAIIARALASDPDARFESPLQLRLALEGYRRHRGSERIAARALERLTELETCLAQADGGHAQEQRIHGLVSECRFGFREALAQWPDNETARVGLRRTLTVIVGHLVTTGDSKGARAHLSELDVPDAELRARVSAAEAEQAARAGRIRALEKDHDQRTGMRTRTFVAVVSGAVWTLAPIVGGELLGPALGHPRPTYGLLYALPAVCLVVFIAVILWARESLMATALNRRLGLTPIALLALQPGLVYIGQRYGLDTDVVLTLSFACWTTTATVLAIALHPQLALTAVGYGLVTVLSLHFPEYNLRLAAFGNVVLTLNLVWMGQPVLREDLERLRAPGRSTSAPD